MFSYYRSVYMFKNNQVVGQDVTTVNSGDGSAGRGTWWNQGVRLTVDVRVQDFG